MAGLRAWVSMGMTHNAEGKRTSLKAKVFFEPICKANLKHKGQDNIPKASRRTNEKALYLGRLHSFREEQGRPSVPEPKAAPIWLPCNHCPLSSSWGIGFKEEGMTCRISG